MSARGSAVLGGAVGVPRGMAAVDGGSDGVDGEMPSSGSRFGIDGQRWDIRYT